MQAFKITTANVNETLVQTAKEYKTAIETIDFDLLSYQTLYRGTVDEEWSILEVARLEDITTENEIRASPFEVRQEYELLIHPLQPHPHFDIRLNLASDKHKTKVIATIDPSSTLPLKKGIQEYIKKVIRDKKLRSGLLIGITDNDLDTEINKLLLTIQKKGPLKVPYRMNITNFFSPQEPVDDSIKLHYKKEAETNHLVEGVLPDEFIFEYFFPLNGRDGRSCTGAFIQVREPLVQYAYITAVDPESIRLEESNETNSIRFYARRSGYVQENNGVISINQELHLNEATFKQTGSIETGSDKEVHLKINHDDQSKDAVGTGVTIDVQTLDIKGTVGSNTKIQACEVTIGAQTHKKSQIAVEENATIHLHRGNLKAKNATIEVLEAGKVEAETVRISKMHGGEIIADHVIIDTLYSNAKITALKSITITSIVGEGNNLIIDPRSIPSYVEQINTFELHLKKTNTHIQEKRKELLGKELSLKEQTNRIKHIQQRIKMTMAQQVPPLKADLVRLEQFKHALSDLRNEQIALNTQEENIQTIEDELNKLYDADLHAEIKYQGSYNGHTQILYVDPKTSQKYTLLPQGTINRITLIRDDEEKKFRLES